jgi:hypothetical protein
MTNEDKARTIIEATHDWRRDEHDADTSGWRSYTRGHLWRLCRRCGLVHQILLFPSEHLGRVGRLDGFILDSGEQLGLEEAAELDCPVCPECGEPQADGNYHAPGCPVLAETEESEDEDA